MVPQMNDPQLLHQKKVRLMGTLLAIISWLGIAVLGLAFVLLFYFAADTDSVLNELSLIADVDSLIDRDKVIGRLKPGAYTVEQTGTTDFVMLDTKNQTKIPPYTGKF